MNLKIVGHPAEKGGYWAEVPALPGRASQSETMEELVANTRDAIEAWLSVDSALAESLDVQIIEIAV